MRERERQSSCLVLFLSQEKRNVFKEESSPEGKAPQSSGGAKCANRGREETCPPPPHIREGNPSQQGKERQEEESRLKGPQCSSGSHYIHKAKFGTEKRV